MKKYFFLIFFASVFCLFASDNLSEIDVKDEEKMQSELVSWLKEIDLEARVDKDKNIFISNYPQMLVHFNPQKQRLHFISTCAKPDNLSKATFVEAINKINADKIFIQACVDGDGDPYFGFFMVYAGGISKTNFIISYQQFRNDILLASSEIEKVQEPETPRGDKTKISKVDVSENYPMDVTGMTDEQIIGKLGEMFMIAYYTNNNDVAKQICTPTAYETFEQLAGFVSLGAMGYKIDDARIAGGIDLIDVKLLSNSRGIARVLDTLGEKPERHTIPVEKNEDGIWKVAVTKENFN